jgi:hypothetical protein
MGMVMEHDKEWAARIYKIKADRRKEQQREVKNEKQMVNN